MEQESNSDPDAELVSQARDGSAAAFEQLVRRHTSAVYRQAYNVLRDQEDAADVTQEAFVRAHERVDTFRAESRFSTWLRRIATNLALMKLRSRRRRPEHSIEELLPSFLEDGHHTQAIGAFSEPGSFDEELARRELVCLALAELPDNYREILVLRCVQELDTKQAAETLQISITAVKLRLHRAHQALRTLLAEHFEQTEANQ